ncbi:hypothetical protein [Clostridium sp.]|uniref:hypothetical protein n=1 Tax=Clostridium sp. TaxID=1506 RepID=UPI001A5C45F2|nr:hypothetical protein [Clostridium sp.]MBK5240812.1 hypothetical protein [Clostridium sp.]
MYLLFIFALLCSGAAIISLKFDKKIEETFSLWIFLIILILYLFGLLGFLKIGVYSVIAIGVVSMFFCCYSIYSNRQNFIKNVMTPGFAMFIVFFVLAWWAQKGRMLTSWDEFSHWGTVVKNMYILDALGNHPDATTVFRGYPPATALFEYLWMKLSGNFTEGNLYMAMNILYFSLMIPVFSNIRWKNASKIVIRFILILILPLAFFQDFYSIIMVDAILGVMFAYILITYYVNEMSTFKIINISLALFVLTITKASGFGLAIISIIVIALDLIFVKRQELKKYIKQDKKINTVKRIVLVLCPIIFALLSKYSWSIYIKITKTNEAWNTSEISLLNIKSLFNGNAPHYQMATIKNFINAFSELFLTDYTLKLSFMSWIVLLIVISIILIQFICNDSERSRFKLATISLFMGSAIYTLSLLILYVFTYSEYEATKLASYSRYSGTYLLGVLIFLVMTISFKEQRCITKFKVAISSCILLSLLLNIKVTPVINCFLLGPYNTKGTITLRASYAPITKIKQVVNSKTDKLYFISVADNGFDFWVSRYNITPIKTNLNSDSWSLGKPYYKGDIWTKDIDVDVWAEELKSDYTYVYIYRTNDTFNKRYGEIFEGGSTSIKNDTLYYVKLGATHVARGMLIKVEIGN